MMRTLLLIILASFTASCAFMSPALQPEEKVNPTMGYIYGRFTFVEHDNGWLHLRMGVVIESIDQKKSYTLQFIREDIPSMIAVLPGTYRIKKVVFATAEYEKQGEKYFQSSSLTEPFQVSSGKAYYIGDFDAEFNTSVRGTLNISQLTQSWELKTIYDHFESTTTDTKVRFPNLQSLEFVHPLQIHMTRFGGVAPQNAYNVDASQAQYGIDPLLKHKNKLGYTPLTLDDFSSKAASSAQP